MRFETHIASRTVLLLLFGILFIIGFVIWLLLSSKYQKPVPVVCGYDSCPKSEPNKLNIHLICHSHNDVGSFDSHGQVYLNFVLHVIDSVIEALLKHPERRFVYAEMIYLWEWWKNQNETKRKTLKKLINEGRFEILGGGWTMNDEAVTHYQSIIDQYTLGLRRAEDTFGACARPRVGWQINSFGHSLEQASIFAQMGFDGLFVGRLDFQYKIESLNKKIAEFLWKTSNNLGYTENLFTSILYNKYSPPPGFCFDVLCEERIPIIDDFKDLNYNVHRRAEQFLTYAKKQASSYRTNNIIFTMGDGLHYTKAELWYGNMDRLIKYINERRKKEIHIFYSTPSCYLKALNGFNGTWPIKTSDLFPYSTNPNSFWSGFYTSRPTLKFAERMGNNFLQVVKQLSVLTQQPASEEFKLYKETMGLMQNIITGTAKSQVISDYLKILYQSIENGTLLASKSIKNWTSKSKAEAPEFNSCLLLNISCCDYSSENRIFIVTVYNPTSQPLATFVRLPVQKYFYGVKDFTGNDIVTQLVPIPKKVQTIPGRVSSATMELVFRANNIPPLGYQSFYVYRHYYDGKECPGDPRPSKNSFSIETDYYQVSVDPEGRVHVYCTKGARDLHIRQFFEYYEGAEGNNRSATNPSSGTYIFRPKQQHSNDVKKNSSYQIFKGPLIQEIHLVINDWISQIVRMYNGRDTIEFDWLVGPIPVEDKIGKEIISKFSSNIQNNGVFYTDSMGREMIKRKLYKRPYYKLSLIERVAGNYYPVTTKISIQDKRQMLRMSVLPDRAQGGSSLMSGEIELMVHRRLLNDDSVGLDQSLNEMAFGKGLVVKGKHSLVIGSLMDRNELILQEKEQAIEFALRPWLFFTPTTYTFQEWNDRYKMQNGGLKKDIPKNVRILTLEPWKNGEILLRLEHIFEVGETLMYSVTAQVDLKELFSGFTILSIREMTLDANQRLADSKKLEWFSHVGNDNLNHDKKAKILPVSVDSTVVHLDPMQIRTFVLKITYDVKK